MKWFNQSSKIEIKPQVSIAEVTEHAPFLPLEILQQWMAQLDREDLKACRLVNHAFGEAATQILFSKVHFSANKYSLERLKEVANCPHIAQHVRCLIFYPGSWCSNTKDAHLFQPRKFWSLRNVNRKNAQQWKTAVDSWLIDWPRESKIVQKRLDQNLFDEACSQVNFPSTWVAEVQEILRVGSFPQLTQVIHPLVSFWTDPSKYHVRRTGRGQRADHNKTFNTDSILFTTRYVTHLRTLDLQGVSLDYLWIFSKANVDNHEQMLHQFHQLQTLRLGFTRTYEWDIQKSPWQPTISSELKSAHDGLQQILKACAQSLNHLSIGAGVHVSRLEQHAVTRAITRTTFPHLRHLDLHDMTIQEEQFLTFLTQHPTLRILHITNWAMPVPAFIVDNSHTASTSSFTRTFYRIAQSTNLDNVQLRGDFIPVITGLFVSEGLRYWQAHHYNKSPSPSPSTKPRQPYMLEKIESYLSQRGPFPWSSAVLEFLETESELEDPEIEWIRRFPRNRGRKMVWTYDFDGEVEECRDWTWEPIDDYTRSYRYPHVVHP